MEIIWSTVLTVWGWLLDHLLYINLAFSIIIIFFQRRDPRSVWTWLLALYFIPVFGIVFYLLFGQDMKKSRMFRVKEVSDRLNLPVKSQEDIIRSDDMPEEMMDPMSRDFKSLIIYNLETSGSVLTVNNQVQIYTDGQAKFEALRNALRQARRFIHIQYYIIKNDELFDSIVPILLDKVREGVEVRILCDGMGGRFMPKKRWDQMRRAGIKVGVFFPPFLGWLNLRVNYRNHRKIVVVDGAAGFVGGFNIGREYISRDPKFGYWRDTHLEIKGEAAISLQIRFALDWNYVTGENLFKEIRYFGEEAEYARRRLNGRNRNAAGLTGFIRTILPGFGRLLLHCGQKAVISGRGRCFGGFVVPAKIAAQAELRAVGAVPVKQAFFGVCFALGLRARNRGAKFLFALVGVQVPAAGKPQRHGQPAYRRRFGIHNNGQAVFVLERLAGIRVHQGVPLAGGEIGINFALDLFHALVLRGPPNRVAFVCHVSPPFCNKIPRRVWRG